jgi:aryl-alcohol dehydrogenase-like predicted oxidoreductase
MGHDVGTQETLPFEMTPTLSLGTAQFGLPYGIANDSGQVRASEAHALLNLALDHGIRRLDTASGYGSSEAVIGAFGSAGWRVTTKLAALPDICDDIATWVESEIRGSLARLGTTSVHTVLLHRPEDLLGCHGKQLHKALMACRAQGLFVAQGVSLYSTGDLERFVGQFDIDTVQLPFNILDRGLVVDGHARRLRDAGVELQVRSIFLQGLLLLPLEEQVCRFPASESVWRAFANWTSEHQVSPYEACVRFVMGQTDLDAVVVGVDKCEHLTALLTVSERPPLDVPAHLVSEDPEVIDPRRWQ